MTHVHGANIYNSELSANEVRVYHHQHDHQYDHQNGSPHNGRNHINPDSHQSDSTSVQNQTYQQSSPQPPQLPPKQLHHQLQQRRWPERPSVVASDISPTHEWLNLENLPSTPQRPASRFTLTSLRNIFARVFLRSWTRPDQGVFIAAVLLIVAPCVLTSIFIVPYLWGNGFAWITVIAFILVIAAISMIFATSFTDPGYVPRNLDPHPSIALAELAPTAPEVQENNLYPFITQQQLGQRPPQPSPSSTLSYSKTILVNNMDITVKYCNTCIWVVVMMFVYHTWLISNGITTHEQIRKGYGAINGPQPHINPYDQGTTAKNFYWALCRPLEPSREYPSGSLVPFNGTPQIPPTQRDMIGVGTSTPTMPESNYPTDARAVPPRVVSSVKAPPKSVSRTSLLAPAKLSVNLDSGPALSDSFV
ncbi:hypothetical protein BASA50_003418 [Batrachochytrium salamandrivorans]|uniref:Palmitoyltransferase n=1 Tax=Batrachochytrium salamandrivorans TaxID=1357716 RepID=A0ABQ8FIM4_9FUNG|nr:hypothetical protein BASA60_002556 [Batrachochytrium salamandrivorans]KAH6598912.1 hypothetical protein BASA50_003418 [Batrachochytrium salamandrivorans]